MNILLPDNYELLFNITIPGNLPRKSNQRRVVKNKKTGKILVIKSANALNYSEAFKNSLPPELLNRKFIGNLLLIVNIYYASRRSDVSDELLCDLLQKNGVVNNDRDIVEKIVFGFVDKLSPRVEAALYNIISHTPINVGETKNGYVVFK